MGSYTVIADVSRTIIELLRNNLVPEPIKKAETIGVCSPNDRGNIVLALCLYNIEENAEMRTQPKIVPDKSHIKDPPISINLYYMLFAYSDSEISTRFIDEQRILGKAMQQLNDNRVMPNKYLVGTLKDNNETVSIQNININLDEKVKIWSLFNQPYRIAAFYKVGPVLIESTNIKNISRVSQADIYVEQK